MKPLPPAAAPASIYRRGARGQAGAPSAHRSATTPPAAAKPVSRTAAPGAELRAPDTYRVAIQGPKMPRPQWKRQFGPASHSIEMRSIRGLG